MYFLATFIVAFGLAILVIATPVLNVNEGGITIPLSRRSAPLHSYSNKSVDIHVISSHAVSVRNKVLRGLDNYEKNTGITHQYAVQGSESRKRSAGLPLTSRRGIFWTGEISVGTPLRVFDVEIDTGSRQVPPIDFSFSAMNFQCSDMFVLTPYCGSSCGDFKVWNPDMSETAKDTGQDFELTFGDGTIVLGAQFTDNVTIAGHTAYPQTVGAATQYHSPLRNHMAHADGLLGLAFSSISKYPASNLFNTLISQKKVFNPTLSFKLSASGAELYIGGANSNLYKGNIAYTRVTDQGFWQVAMDDIRVDGKKVLEDIPIIIDTGANYIFGDWERVSALYSWLGGTPMEYAGFGYYYLPCDSFRTVSLTFGGRSFEIPPDVLRLGPIEDGSNDCFGGIIASDESTTLWNLGSLFLQRVYTVLDYSALQVGFADLS